MDLILTKAINSRAGTNPWLDGTMVFITSYGVQVLVLAVMLMWWTRSQRQETRHTCIVACAAFLLSLAINQGLLLFIHRIRPYELGITHLLISPNSDWSFPSDHATAASAVVAAFWFRGVRPLVLVAPLWVTLICFSRIYVGVHYVSDIAGGVVIGTCTAWFVSAFYRENAWPFRKLVALF